MSGPAPSRRRRVHALLEHYTPDGTAGRVLLALPLLALSVVMVGSGFIAGNVVVAALSFLLVPLFLVVGLVTLWPIYQSLIGNTESPEAYAQYGAAAPRSGFGEADPTEALKKRYAAGEISDEEFDRRLDRLLSTERRVDSDRREARRESPEREPIRERSN